MCDDRRARAHHVVNGRSRVPLVVVIESISHSHTEFDLRAARLSRHLTLQEKGPSRKSSTFYGLRRGEEGEPPVAVRERKLTPLLQQSHCYL